MHNRFHVIQHLFGDIYAFELLVRICVPCLRRFVSSVHRFSGAAKNEFQLIARNIFTFRSDYSALASCKCRKVKFVE